MPEEVETFIVSYKDKDDVCQLLKEAYVPFEPLCCALQLSYEDYKPIMDREVSLCLDSGVSIGMRDRTSMKLVGCMLSMINSSTDFDLYPKDVFTNEKTSLYAELMNNLCSDIDVLKDGGFKKQLELMLLSVHPSHSNHGMAKCLIKACEERGKDLGCDVATIQAMNVIVEHITKKMNYKELYSMDIQTLNNKKNSSLFDLRALKRNGTDHFTYLYKSL